MRTERHHVEPVSLFGLDIQQNIIELKQDIHKALHQEMDIPHREYSRRHRKHRQKFNKNMITSPDEIDSEANIQRLFFYNINKLPNRLIQKHVQTMMALFSYHEGQYKRATGDNLDKPRRVSNQVGQFNELHTAKTNARKELAKVFIDSVKKKHY